MAIKLTNIRIKGKRVTNEMNLDIVKILKKFLNKKKITCDFSITRYYSDRWFDLEYYKRTLEKEKKHEMV